MEIVLEKTSIRTHSSAYDEWRFHRSPESKMVPTLGEGEVAISDLEHVCVAVGLEANHVHEEAVHIGDDGDPIPVCYRDTSEPYTG
jgi:hypothetical protein